MDFPDVGENYKVLNGGEGWVQISSGPVCVKAGTHMISVIFVSEFTGTPSLLDFGIDELVLRVTY